MKNYKQLIQLVKEFCIEGTVLDIRAYGSGHINETYLVEVEFEGHVDRYILQQINHEVFKRVDHLMENVMGVTSYLKEKIEERGGDSTRETLQLILTRDNKTYRVTEEGKYFRVYYFIKDAVTYDMVERQEDFYESAVAFGNFQYLLSDYPADTLYETIPNFHHTPKRYLDFCKAVEEDVCGRVKLAKKEIEFVKARAQEMGWITDKLESGELPLRVTHNDTKLNNVMLDSNTGKGICVLDLDTVMPGSSLYDFGDAIRYGANSAAEDERDLSKVYVDLNLYEWYVKGYLEGCKGSLTDLELDMLPVGAKLMTLECGMRFLTDYLQGDVYFRIHRENHNLDRCRTHFTMIRDMEEKWQQMFEIVAKYR